MKPRAQVAKDSRAKHRASYNAYMRDYRKQRPEKSRALARASYERHGKSLSSIRARRRYHLKTAYGLSLEQYERMFCAQQGVCAICSLPETSVQKGTQKSLAVDHDHETGQVRELLCRACNAALGLLKEDPTRIQALLKYLEKHDGI